MKIRQSAFILPLTGLLLSVLSTGLQTAMADLNTGLLAYYPFNGNAIDETGNGYDGTVVGATLNTDRLGNPESAYLFDGVDDQIIIGQAPEDFPSLDTYAVSVWFLNDGGGVQEPMPGQYWPGYGQKILSKADFYTDFHLSVGPDEWIYESTGESSPAGYLAWWSDQGGFEMVKDTSKDYRDSTWHHAVLNKKTANEGDLWVDGVLLASSTTLAAVVNDADLIIGYTAHTDPLQQRYWSGKIDDIRIYNRVLSESEIAALFTESGQTDDQDGDGVTDGEDTCPDSDLSATVMVNGCDAGVANPIFPTGCTLSDLVALCADDAPRHNRYGKTFSCVARLTRILQQVGVITSQQKGAIQRCATKKPKSQRSYRAETVIDGPMDLARGK